jgi:hypothetical protein
MVPVLGPVVNQHFHVIGYLLRAICAVHKSGFGPKRRHRAEGGKDPKPTSARLGWASSQVRPVRDHPLGQRHRRVADIDLPAADVSLDLAQSSFK